MQTNNQEKASYDFGNWGIYTSERGLGGDIISGFTALPPDTDAIGEYDLISAASFKISGDNTNKKVMFRKLIDGYVSISKCVKPFIARVEPRQSENLRRVRVICQEVNLKVDLLQVVNSSSSKYSNIQFLFLSLSAQL